MRTVQAICSLLWLGSALLCGNAIAGEATRERVVKYADLNLNNPAGVQTLYRRINAAARAVCGRNDALSISAPGRTSAQRKPLMTPSRGSTTTI